MYSLVRTKWQKGEADKNHATACFHYCSTDLKSYCIFVIFEFNFLVSMFTINVMDSIPTYNFNFIA